MIPATSYLSYGTSPASRPRAESESAPCSLNVSRERSASGGGCRGLFVLRAERLPRRARGCAIEAVAPGFAAWPRPRKRTPTLAAAVFHDQPGMKWLRRNAGCKPCSRRQQSAGDLVSGKESRRVAPPLPQGRDRQLRRAGSGNGRFVTPQITSWTRRPSTVVTPRSGASHVSKIPGLSGAGRRQENWLPGGWPRAPVRVSSREDGHRRRWLLERRPQSPEHTFPQPQSDPDGTHRSNPAARIGTGPARCRHCVTRRRCRRPEGHSPEWSRTGRSRSSHRPCRLRPPVPVR